MAKTSLTAIQDSAKQPSRVWITLYKVMLTQGTIYYLAQHDSDVTANDTTASGTPSQTWQAFAHARSEAKSNADMQIDTLDVTIPNARIPFAGSFMMVTQLAIAGIFEKATVHVLKWNKSSPGENPFWFWSGQVLTANITRRDVSLRLESLLSIALRQIPRTFFDEKCVAPEMRVLTADLRWVKAGDVQVGQELVAFDEEGTDSVGRRMWRTALVESVTRRTAPCVEVELKHGSLVVSEDHKFLVHRYPNSWCEAKSLHPESVVKQLVKPWNDDSSFETGYISGMLDAEGSFHCPAKSKGSPIMTFGQNRGVVFNRVERGLKRFGKWNAMSNHTTDKCLKLATAGVANVMQSLGMFRPLRLLTKAGRFWEGRVANAHRVSVRSVKPVGIREVVSIRTSTRTFIVEGVLSHNCNNQVFDTWCALKAATYQQSLSVLTSSTQGLVICSPSNVAVFTGQSPTPGANGYWDLGQISMTSGLNNGVVRSIKQSLVVSGNMQLTLLQPLPFQPNVGDTFNALPGCDLSIGTCINKFNNLNGQVVVPNTPAQGGYRGFPRIPKPTDTL